MVETIFVIALFLLYVILWRIKQIRLKRETGIDAQVMNKSKSNIQQYMAAITTMLTLYGALIILAQAFNVQIGSLFTRINELSSTPFDIAGFTIGLIGLSFCLYAQIKMGASWRVGIDENAKTPLVTSGLYAYIRNPTYLGLFLLNIGIWLIWPTWATFLLNFLFILFLEVQVRCEEDYLTTVHGGVYEAYKEHTKRYIPFIY
jgi:protein-S-isoprenylcysteine O-methyltransferase Ste14